MNIYLEFENELRSLFKEEKDLAHCDFGMKFAKIIIRIKKTKF